ncbi:hypothetical protein D3C72_2355780 [compost metagenome]
MFGDGIFRFYYFPFSLTSTGLSRYFAGNVFARFSTFGTSFTKMYMLFGWRTR